LDGVSSTGVILGASKLKKGTMGIIPTPVKGESCLIQDEPGGGVGFSYKMSPEE
jgi:hypothetical protein